MAQQPEVYGVLYKFLGCAFDIYFVDYRGTGRSHNLGSAGCIDPTTGIDAIGCAAASNATWGDKLEHFSVTNIARDFDRIIPMLTQQQQQSEVTFTLGYSWGTYVSNRLLQVMAARPDGKVYLSGAVLDAVCTPGLCKATNIGSYQDRCGRMLLSRYCARDPVCAARLGGDPEHYAAAVFDSLDAGELPCAKALGLRRPELQTLLGELAGAHWPEMRLPMVAPLLYRLRHCTAADEVALNHSITRARAGWAVGVPLPPGGSIVQELNVEYSDMWRASLGAADGEALVPPQGVLDAQYEYSFMFANNGPNKFRGFNGKTVRPGYEPWSKFAADEFTGKFAPPIVPLLLLNGDLDPAVDNDGSAQQSAGFYGASGFVARGSPPSSAAFSSRGSVRLMTIPYAGHTTLGQSPVRCSDAKNPLLCTMGADGVGINGPFTPSCGAQLAISFIQNASGPLNTSCLQHLFPLDLEGSLALTQQTALAEFGTTNLWD
jgi:pimeloyl-ACP methyl ester carboxylesterase